MDRLLDPTFLSFMLKWRWSPQNKVKEQGFISFNIKKTIPTCVQHLFYCGQGTFLWSTKCCFQKTINILQHLAHRKNPWQVRDVPDTSIWLFISLESLRLVKYCKPLRKIRSTINKMKTIKSIKMPTGTKPCRHVDINDFITLCSFYFLLRNSSSR